MTDDKSKTGSDDNSDDSVPRDYYSDDVQAAAIADNNLNPSKLKEDKSAKQEPITTGETAIGDLDIDDDKDKDPTASPDEQNDPIAGGV